MGRSDEKSLLRLDYKNWFLSKALCLTHLFLSCSFLVIHAGGSQLLYCEGALWIGPCFERSRPSNNHVNEYGMDLSPGSYLGETGSRLLDFNLMKNLEAEVFT